MFKAVNKNRKTISKNKEDKILEKIKNLNIGLVDIVTIPSFGRYIIIRPYNRKDNLHPDLCEEEKDERK